MKKYILILITIFTFNKLSFCNPIAQMYKDDPWKYVEFIFIQSPELKMKQMQTRLIHYGLTTTAGLTGLLFTHKLLTEKILNIDDSDYDFDDRGDRLKFMASLAMDAGGLLIPSLITYFAMKTLLKKHFEYANLKNFLTDWENNKIATPKELHEIFDGLEKTFARNSNLFSEQAGDFIFNIKNRIYEKFPEKYATIAKQEFDFTFKIFSFDVGGTLTGLANLFKVIFK